MVLLRRARKGFEVGDVGGETLSTGLFFNWSLMTVLQIKRK